MGQEDKKTFNSVAEIDAALDEEFKLVEPKLAETKEETIEDEDLDEIDDLDEDEDLDDLDEDEDDDTEPASKPDKKAQEGFAFAKLRADKEAAERKAAQEIEFMKKLAKASGYGDDVEKYRKDLEDRLISAEAQQRGVTPEVYKELADAKAKNEIYEKEKQESARLAKSQKFLSTIDAVLSNYDVDAKEMSKELFKSLEDAGYTIDTLLAIPQPEFLIKGVLYEKLASAKMREDKLKGGVETKKITSKTAPVKTVDELVEEEMVAYAKSRGLKYVK